MLDNEIVGRMKDNVSVCYIFIISGQLLRYMLLFISQFSIRYFRGM